MGIAMSATAAEQTLRLEKVAPVPNAAYVPMVIIQTGLMGGKPLTSWQITLSSAVLDAGRDTLAPSGQSEMIHIAPGERLPDGVAEALDTIHADLLAVIAQINAERKVL